MGRRENGLARDSSRHDDYSDFAGNNHLSVLGMQRLKPLLEINNTYRGSTDPRAVPNQRGSGLQIGKINEN